jgi:hypothetical protein
MAKISVIKEAVMLCGRAGITPFIWGHRGLGKSSLVKQLASDNGMGFIDLRCSQLEASDIRGLPKAGDDGRTHYLPPADMPIGNMSIESINSELSKIDDTRLYNDKFRSLQCRYKTGILFLDEINRSQDDVQQSVFQLVLDRSVGQYTLPPGWFIVAAGNFMEGYMVTGFTDQAFLDRFCHMILSSGEETFGEWVEYMSDTHGDLISDIIEFTSHNVDHLDGKLEGELGFNISPSRRSWDMIARINAEFAKGEYSEAARVECYAGLIGRDLALSYSKHSCPIKPNSIVAHGVGKYENELKKLSRNQLTGLMWGLVSICRNNIDREDIINVCVDFSKFVASHAQDKDVAVAFCRALVGADKRDKGSKIRAAAISNPSLANMLSKINKSTNKNTFIDVLSKTPELQKIMSNVSWGE